jgi:hypothetical protein
MYPLMAQSERLRDVTHRRAGGVKPPDGLVELRATLFFLMLQFGKAITCRLRVPEERDIQSHTV